MKDRMVFGALAGAIGAVLQEIYGYSAKLFGFTDRGYIDFAKAVITYEVKDGTLETILAITAHIALDLLLGIMFAYIIKNSSDNYYYIKAFIYGYATWFVLQTAGAVLRLPAFFHISSRSLLVTLIGAFLYSFVTAFILKRTWTPQIG